MRVDHQRKALGGVTGANALGARRHGQGKHEEGTTRLSPLADIVGVVVAVAVCLHDTAVSLGAIELARPLFLPGDTAVLPRIFSGG